MPVYKNEKNGTWYAMVRYKDWTGQNKQKCQRGFATRREALEWEAQFKLQKTADIDMTLERLYRKWGLLRLSQRQIMRQLIGRKENVNI